ncbi:hypothetical protein ABZU53_30825 [Micromonospora sp. NPDC005194]|uniref:hypothetical protein n=1 Tax=Micromonospora sp. NPDC005194 TaxID=3156870 RepID=UPI0033B34017
MKNAPATTAVCAAAISSCRSRPFAPKGTVTETLDGHRDLLDQLVLLVDPSPRGADRRQQGASAAAAESRQSQQGADLLTPPRVVLAENSAGGFERH